jgi:hypothetical protein
MHQDEMSEPNNISFDSDTFKAKGNADTSSVASQPCRLMIGSFQVLDNLTMRIMSILQMP